MAETVKLSDLTFYEPMPDYIAAVDKSGELYRVMYYTGELQHFPKEKPDPAWDRATIEDARRVIEAGKARAADKARMS
ncbi:MAG: hypothetical protein LBL64_07885 [Treponema sp.]|jgi:hypothetical protein|nr:hypothetical protein [Treponema sp.]